MDTIVILWTDALVFLLVFAVLMLAFKLRQSRQFLEQWHSVFKTRVGASTSIILLTYIVVGLMDSAHYHPSQINESGVVSPSAQVISVLDFTLSELKSSTEKSYSAPFAKTLYVKENIQINNVLQRGYPALEKRALHLSANESVFIDVLVKGVIGASSGMACMLVIIFAIGKVNNKGLTGMFSTSSQIQWRSISITLLSIGVFMGSTLYLSSYFHVLGTDKVGQDVLYLSLKSIRTGLVIGTLTTLIMLPIAILLGIMAGFYRSWVDDIIQYIYTTLNSIPGILLIAASVLMLQVFMDNNPDMFSTVEERSDARLFFLCLILGVTSWTGLCRLLRGETLKIRELDFIQAAKALGSSNMTIIRRHILPNLMHIVLISIVLDFSGLVLAEAVLAYVGIGVDPTMNSWGNMINSARLEMSREPIVWWSLMAAFWFMFVLVLAANLFSDAIRDAFDPKLRSR